MTESSFQTEVLLRFDRMETTQARIELMVTGAADDPNNQGIHGKLKLVDREIEYLRQQDKSLSKRVSRLDKIQDRQRTWIKGAMATGGTGLFAVLAKLYNIGPL